MKLTHILQIATKALITNSLYGVSKKDLILGFNRSDEHPIYLLNIIRVVEFFTNDSPEKVLFTLKIPYLVELNIEDDLESIDNQKGLENFWYSIQEVSPEIKMFYGDNVEIQLALTTMQSKNEINWLNQDFLHSLCHANIFSDLLGEEDAKFKFNERPIANKPPFLMDKLNLEQYLLLDLKCVFDHEKLLN